jgi:hypothetical protein
MLTQKQTKTVTEQINRAINAIERNYEFSKLLTTLQRASQMGHQVVEYPASLVQTYRLDVMLNSRKYSFHTAHGTNKFVIETTPHA